MRLIVLDTHALIWMDCNDPALGPRARNLIEDGWRTGDIAVSAISYWEVAMLAQRGRIALPVAADRWRTDLFVAGVKEIALDGRIALLSTTFEDLDKDPADRFIAATALQHDALLITADRRLLDWRSDLRRHDARQ